MIDQDFFVKIAVNLDFGGSRMQKASDGWMTSVDDLGKKEVWKSRGGECNLYL